LQRVASIETLPKLKLTELCGLYLRAEVLLS
jgi:hypothetical protein